MIFKPCTGECTDDGTHCEGCGRSHEEIAEMRQLVGALVDFAERMEYKNFNDFSDGVAASIKYTMSGEH